MFGHAAVVRALIEHGADPASRASDARTALDVVMAARAEEKDAAVVRAPDEAAVALRDADHQK